MNDPKFLPLRVHIVDLTLRSQVPSVFGRREYVAAGGLMSYVSSSAWHWRSAASFVDKILKGTKPADIAVEQPTKFELVINLKTGPSAHERGAVLAGINVQTRFRRRDYITMQFVGAGSHDPHALTETLLNAAAANADAPWWR